MSGNFDCYVQRYHNKGFLIDTNLLLMLFIGSIMDVSEFKRTKKDYKQSDYDLLLAFADKFEQIITTPNILTEVSNLIGRKTEKSKSTHLYNKKLEEFYQRFTQSLALATLSEEYIQSQSIPKEVIYKYGLTDAGIVHLVKDKYLLLTDDLPLFGFATGKNIDAINLNHIRFQIDEA